MIYMLSQSWAENNSKALAEKILPHLGITSNDVTFVSTAHDVIDVAKFAAIVCFDRSYKDVSKAFTSAGIFKIRDMIGRDLITPDGSFVLFNIPYTLTQIFTNDETKAIAWEKLLAFIEAYKNMPSFAESSGVDVVSTDESVSDDSTDDVAVANVFVDDIIQQVSSYLDFSDPAIGKTLGLSSKIVLSGSSGTITIHPTGERIPKDDGTAHLSIKDVIALLKASLAFDADTITFYKKQT